MADTKSLVVIGHRNPDTDSICSAIGYAHYKTNVEKVPATAFRAGSLNAQTRHVLETFGVETPELLTDVYPRIRDIMIPREMLIVIRPTDAIAGARQLMLENRFTFLPITDTDGRCVGKLTAVRLAGLLDEVDPFINGEAIDIDLNTLAELGGPSFYIGADPDDPAGMPEWIAGTVRSTTNHTPHGGDGAGTILFGPVAELIQVGPVPATIAIATGASDDETIQGNLKQWAAKTGIPVLGLAAELAQASAYLRLSQAVSSCIEPVGPTFHSEDTLREALREVNKSNEGGFVVLEADETIGGVVTRVNFMTDARFSVVLVDHNEFSQSVDGIEHAQVAEIIDHHRIGGRSTSEPMTFVNRAVGSTCTIVAEIYRQSGSEPPREVAGLLLSGILSDTIILRSPTATNADRIAAGWLAGIAAVEMDEYGESMFEAGSEMQNLSPREIIELDLKYYDEEGVQFSVSQIEMTGFKAFWDRSEIIGEAIDAHRARAGLGLACLMVTDITHSTTLLVVSGESRFTGEISYPQAGPGVYEMNGVLSRKKQVLPYLVDLVHGL